MYIFVVALHVVLSLFLILIIILQPGKGGDVGAAFGGGGGGSGSTMFGPRGPAGLLQRATTIVAVMFMGTSITLALYSNQRILSNNEIDYERIGTEQGAEDEASEAPEDPAPSDEPE